MLSRLLSQREKSLRDLGYVIFERYDEIMEIAELKDTLRLDTDELVQAAVIAEDTDSDFKHTIGLDQFSKSRRDEVIH